MDNRRDFIKKASLLSGGAGFLNMLPPAIQKALAIEMTLQGLKFEREKEMQIYYKDHHIGTRRVDFFVEENIMVELKALINLEDVHLAQAKNYVVAYDLPTGLLINFGAASLQYKKVFNQKYNSVTPKS